MTDATVIIIGDEILAGRFQDENGPYLIRRLRQLGVDLVRLVVIPDKVQIIAEEVARGHARTTWVVTSGGIGPTHDDITFAGIAQALGVPLERRNELVAVLEPRIGPLNPIASRMVEVPQGAEFWWDGDIAYPVTVCDNILVLPGVPTIFRRKFEAIAHRLADTPRSVIQLPCRARETRIAERLERASQRFPTVSIGSYPRGARRVLISLESRDQGALEDCHQQLLGELADAVISWEEWDT